MKQLVRIALAITLLAGGVWEDLALAASAKKTAAAPRKKTAPAAKKTTAKAAPPKPAATKKVRRKTVTRSRRRGRRVRAVRFVPRQAQPTKERLAEIQRALSEKGYFVGAPSGEWNADSISALKSFQEDQSLKATGKINSLSLIALGLGPRRSPLSALPGVPPAATVSDEDAERLEEELEAPLAPEVVPQDQ